MSGIWFLAVGRFSPRTGASWRGVRSPEPKHSNGGKGRQRPDIRDCIVRQVQMREVHGHARVR